MESKYNCKKCLLRFASKSMLEIHSVILHGNKMEEPFLDETKQKLLVVSLMAQGRELLKCPLCNSGFALKNHLLKHKSN